MAKEMSKYHCEKCGCELGFTNLELELCEVLHAHLCDRCRREFDLWVGEQVEVGASFVCDARMCARIREGNAAGAAVAATEIACLRDMMTTKVAAWLAVRVEQKDRKCS